MSCSYLELYVLSVPTALVEAAPLIDQVEPTHRLIDIGKQKHPSLGAFVLAGWYALEPQGSIWFSTISLYHWGPSLGSLGGPRAPPLVYSIHAKCLY